jgi:hypothetical protein
MIDRNVPGDQKVSAHLIVTGQKPRKNIIVVPGIL